MPPTENGEELRGVLKRASLSGKRGTAISPFGIDLASLAVRRLCNDALCFMAIVSRSWLYREYLYSLLSRIVEKLMRLENLSEEAYCII